MKKFIRHFLFFILPIIFGSYFLDLFISNNLKKSKNEAFGEYATWNDLFDGKVNSDIVVYGSSRAWRHISPKIISNILHVSAYNLGIDGHNFWLQYLRHTILLKKNRKPKIIIISVDYFTLQKKSDLYNLEQFLPYMLWNKEIKKSTMSYNGFVYVDYEIPLIRYYGKFKQIIEAIFVDKDKENVKRDRGYEGQNTYWNTDFEKAKLSISKYEVRIDPETVVLFKRFIQECRKNRIKLIFVYTPEYIEGQKFVKNRDEIISIYRRYSVNYDIPFYDYSSDSISFKKEYFYNSNHLNKVGAELFTKDFINKLKNKEINKLFSYKKQNSINFRN